MADQVPVYDPDGNIIGYVSTKEISEGLHVQRVLPSDEAGTTLALATSAKQDIAKGVLDAIAASAASVETGIASVAQETGGNLAAAAGVLGTTADAKIETDASGTISGKLRGAVSLLVSLLARFPTTLLNGRFQVVLATSDNQPVEPIVEPAHDAADDSNGPVKIGGRASTSLPAAVANGDRVNAYFDANGRQVVALDQPLPAGTNALGTVGHGKTLKSVSLSLSTSGDNDIIAAVAAKKLTIYALSLTTKADISAGLTAKFTDGAASTQMWAADALVPATQSWGVVEAVAPPGYLFQLTTNTKLVLNLSAAKATQVNVSYWEE
jgi:hypothetical protein